MFVDRGPVVTLRALQVLLSSVGPLVYLETVSVSKLLPTLTGVVPVISAVQLLHVEPQVKLPAERRVTKLARDDVLLLGVNLNMTLENVTLTEGLGTEGTLVWLLACVHSQMSLQLEGVRGGVGAVRTLVRSLSAVDSHVSPQLAELDRSVLTLRTLVGFLLGMDVPRVSHQLSRGSELCLTLTATVGLYPEVSVAMIEKSSFSF